MTDDRNATPLSIESGRWYAATSDEGRAIIRADYPPWCPDCGTRHDQTDDCRLGGPKPTKRRPPLAKRVAKRRRRKALAKHHKKCMKLAAAGRTAAFPRRPPVKDR